MKWGPKFKFSQFFSAIGTCGTVSQKCCTEIEINAEISISTYIDLKKKLALEFH